MKYLLDLKDIVCRYVGMFAIWRRSCMQIYELFMGKKESVITSEATETSPDTLKDTYVLDPKVASSSTTLMEEDSMEEPMQEKSRYNLRERKTVNYAEESE